MYYLNCNNCKAVTKHVHLGNFRRIGGDAKLVYACVQCNERRVWGSIDRGVSGPQVDPITNWSWLPNFEDGFTKAAQGK